MSTTEENIQTPAPEKGPATGKGAFAEARASIANSDHEPEPVVEETPSETPAEEPDKVADQPDGTTDETDSLLTAEEVSKLSAKERTLYQKAQANYTQKTQKLAAERKEMEQWKPLIDALTSDPDSAIEELAKRRGLSISKAATQDTTPVASATSETLAQLPEELQFLKPVFEQFGKTILASVEGKLKPIAEAQNQMITEAAAAETLSTIEAFSAKYPEWQKHENAMAEMGKKFVPTAGAMTDFEYMETLYKLATFGQSEAEKTKKVVARINKAAESVEPNRSSGTSSDRVEHVLPPPDKRGIRFAFAAAKRGEAWVKD